MGVGVGRCRLLGLLYFAAVPRNHGAEGWSPLGRLDLAHRPRPRYNRPLTSNSRPKARWTKDKSGAALAATTGYFFTFGLARDPAEQLTQDYPHTAASLISLAVSVLAYWIGLRVMKKLP